MANATDIVQHIDAARSAYPHKVGQTYFQRLAEGNTPGTVLYKFGENKSIGSVEELVWSPSIDYNYLAQGEHLKASSTSENDTASGTGCRSIRLYGQDGNFIEQEEVVQLDGTNVVETSKLFMRLYRIRATTAGTVGVNDGDINVYGADGVSLMSRVEQGMGQTRNAFWTVPASASFYVTSVFVNTFSQNELNVNGYTRDNTISNPAWNINITLSLEHQAMLMPFEPPVKLTEKTDIEFRAFASLGGHLSCHVRFGGYYK